MLLIVMSLINHNTFIWWRIYKNRIRHKKVMKHQSQPKLRVSRLLCQRFFILTIFVHGILSKIGKSVDNLRNRLIYRFFAWSGSTAVVHLQSEWHLLFLRAYNNDVNRLFFIVPNSAVSNLQISYALSVRISRHMHRS